MAEGLLNEKIRKYRVNATVDSTGFEPFHLNDPPDTRAIQEMRRHGIDISKHRMRLFNVEDFDNYDRIYVMDNTNYQDVLSLSRNEQDTRKVDFILNVSEPGSNRLVPDPYYGGASGFANVYNLLDKATDAIIRELQLNEIK